MTWSAYGEPYQLAAIELRQRGQSVVVRHALVSLAMHHVMDTAPRQGEGAHQRLDGAFPCSFSLHVDSRHVLGTYRAFGRRAPRAPRMPLATNRLKCVCVSLERGYHIYKRTNLDRLPRPFLRPGGLGRFRLRASETRPRSWRSPVVSTGTARSRSRVRGVHLGRRARPKVPSDFPTL